VQLDRSVGRTNVRDGNGKKKNKIIPSIFKDESTGSCICLRSLIYMSHVLLLCVSFLRVSVLTASMSVSAILVTRCAFNMIL
jgi:hypothetical protein